MSGYPVLLRLKDWCCLIVGGGQVARRKVADLLNAEARVIIVSPQIDPVIAEWEALRLIEVRHQAYTSALLSDLRPRLVFAATDSQQVNRLVAGDAEALGVLVNAVNDRDYSSFYNMAVIQRESLLIALSTQGQSPALAAHLKAKIEQMVGDEYDILAQWMGSKREHVQQMVTEPHKRAVLWQQILASPVLQLIRTGQIESAHQHFEQLINEALN